MNRFAPRTEQAQMRRLSFYVLCGYAVLIVYGSLVPFAFYDRDVARAFSAFLEISYRDLSLDQRADWVANGILYFPLGALLYLSITKTNQAIAKLLVFVIAFGFGAALALAVEFIQMFFPPRTVSINDLVAEFLGTAAGAALAYRYESRLFDKVRRLRRHGADTVIFLAAVAYLGLYVFVSLFPFDFLVSIDELRWKFSERAPRFYYDLSGFNSSVHAAIKISADLFAVLPLGIAVRQGLFGSKLARMSARTIVFGGFVAALGLEVVQHFTASGYANFSSAILGAAGIYLGTVIYENRSRLREVVLSHLGRIVLISMPFYFAAIVVGNGWHGFEFQGLEHIVAKLGSTNYIPFFYHYRTSEQRALLSVLANTALYFPIGVAFGLAFLKSGRDSDSARYYAWFAIISALMCAGIGLAGRVAFTRHFADITNLMIAAGSAFFGVHLVRILLANSGRVDDARLPVHESPVNDRPNAPVFAQFLGLFSLFLVLGGLWFYPGTAWFALFIGAYAVVLSRAPHVWLVLVPASLPLLDLSTVTGWSVVNEFDFLVLTTVAVLLLQRRFVSSATYASSLSRNASRLIALSLIVSFLIAIVRLPGLSSTNLVEYLTSWNAVRLAKGTVLSFALLPFIWYQYKQDVAVPRLFLIGVVLGLLGTGIITVLEHAAVAGLFDFRTPFRAAARFSGMHVGGQHIDGYLALALPASFIFLSRSLPLATRAMAFCAMLFGSYALIVTHSRWTYIVVGAAIVVLAYLHLRQGRDQRGGWTNAVGFAVAVVPVIALILVALGDSYVARRFASFVPHIEKRVSHWASTAGSSCSSLSNCLFGHGVGGFPAFNIARLPPWEQPAGAVVIGGSGTRALQFLPGSKIFIAQEIELPQDGVYAFKAKVRHGGDAAKLNFGICYQNTVSAYACFRETAKLDESYRDWALYSRDITRKELREVLEFSSRSPLGYGSTYFYLGSDAVYALDEVSLSSDSTPELIRNGDFENVGRHWFPISDDYLIWHAENLFVHLFIEQGLLGVIAYALLVIAMLRRSVSVPGGGDEMQRALMVALASFLLVGMAGSLLDSPKLVFLFLLASFVYLDGPRATTKYTASARSQPRNF